MDTRRKRTLPMRLAAVQRRFDAWRGRRKPGACIPERLWKAAVKIAGVYGLHRTARAVRLNYYALKKRAAAEMPVADRVAGVPAVVPGLQAAPPFLELIPSLSATTGECILELENAAGAKMRVQLKGVAMPDLTALSQSFWNRQL